MLAPESRALLTDALRPPEGCRLDAAVATTYSLDLNAMLLAPLTFALFDTAVADGTEIDPIRLLESVRRYATNIAVFCQAGGIAVPASKFSPILAFAEGSVAEVAPRDGVFHPKVWVVRFVDHSGEQIHRVLVSSRNLTFDRSWDTILRLDEDAGPAHAINPGPLTDFLRSIPSLAVGADHSELVEDLCSSLAGVTFALPEPFTEGEFLPRGLGSQGFPFPQSADRTLVISPFLTLGALDSVVPTSEERTLISRPESLDRLGTIPLAGWRTLTFQRTAEVHSDDQLEVSEDSGSGTPLAPPDGLHAKTFIFDVGVKAEVITGSGNLTHSGWHENVEFGVRLRGPVKSCGVAAALEGSTEVPGLEALLSAYAPDSETGVPDPSEGTRLLIERAHATFVESEPKLQITSFSDDLVSASLTTVAPWSDPGETTIRLLTLPGQDRRWRADNSSARWSSLSPRSVTPYLVLETTAGSGVAKATRRCVVKAELHGDIGDRSADALSQLLTSKEDVLRYLILLLGDPSYDDWAAELGGAESGRFTPSAGYAAHDYALFEPLVRAAGRDDVALARVASLVEDLRSLSNGHDLTPEGFDELWAAVWDVHRETMR